MIANLKTERKQFVFSFNQKQRDSALFIAGKLQKSIFKMINANNLEEKAPISVIRKMPPKNLVIDPIAVANLIPLSPTIQMLSPPLTGSSGISATSSASCEADVESDDEDIDIINDSPSPKRMKSDESVNVQAAQAAMFNAALIMSQQLHFNFMESAPKAISDEDSQDRISIDSFNSNGMERRRGRPRKPDAVAGEDGKIIAKRMYARQYRENVS